MRVALAVICTGLFLAAANGHAQSLAELGKRERERREKIEGESQPITNRDTQKYKGGAITTTSGSRPPVSTPGNEKSLPAGDKAGEPVDLLGRPESFWRRTLSDQRQKVKELNHEANALTLKLADLQTRFYREADGFKQQQIQREIQKTIYKQDLNQENLAQAQTRLRDLEKEARESGALPGWLTARNP
jgi:hypothetical protein